ncbi:hypothetical protein IWQ60_001377 [Tieghemiomyces parasiticus]|uniref:Uncharacterized protein n=1 Tax=Tieghemiomyces parasiticus TaxID=78921 RepID=A0A9W8AD62_9FUNG|nr:hypothetical protein IWQ60_001377 [Tieghemiomyces parasiticus]
MATPVLYHLTGLSHISIFISTLSARYTICMVDLLPNYLLPMLVARLITSHLYTLQASSFCSTPPHQTHLHNL